jgi:hypothetical protein
LSEVTANQIIYAGLRYAGLIGFEQQSPSLDQVEEGRQTYNSLVDGLNANGANISHMARVIFPMTPGVGDYTLGPGATWEWPSWVERIQRAGVVLTGQQSPYPEYPIFPLTVDEWQGWVLKDQQTSWPRRYFYERAQPYGIVHLLYVPTDANSVALYLEDAISRIDVGENPTLEDITVTGPPGFQLMLETNLGRQLAARDPARAKISQETIDTARKSLMEFQGPNARPLMRSTDFTEQRRSVIYDGNRYRY